MATSYAHHRPASSRPRRCAELLEAAYADEPFVERASTTRPTRRDVRGTNRCRVYGDGEPASRVLAVSRDRQPLEGRCRPGRAGPEPDARAARDGGAAVSAFFRSRWVEAPAHVRELEPTALPLGLPGRGRGGRAQARGPRRGPCSSRTSARHRVGRALHQQRARGGAGDGVARVPALDGLRAVVANSGGVEHRRRRARPGNGPGHADARRRGAGRGARAGGGGLDRGDRAASCRARGGARRHRGGCEELGAGRRRRSPRSILTSDSGPEARVPGGGARGRDACGWPRRPRARA